MPLIITKRPAQLGRQLNIQPKQVKEDTFARFAIPIVGVPVSEAEFGELLLSPTAAKKFYRHPKDRDPEPAFPMLKSLPMQRVQNVMIALFLGRRVLRMTDVSLVSNDLVLQVGGTTEWNFKIQCMPALDDLVQLLLENLGQQINIELECETYGAQPDLLTEEEPEDADEDDAAEDDQEPPPASSRTQRNIERAALKEARKKGAGH